MFKVVLTRLFSWTLLVLLLPGLIFLLLRIVIPLLFKGEGATDRVLERMRIVEGGLNRLVDELNRT